MSFVLCVEEVAQVEQNSIHLATQDHPPWDLRHRRPSSEPAFFTHAEHWTNEHLEGLRVVPLIDLPIERVIPPRFLPANDDPQLLLLYADITKQAKRGFDNPVRRENWFNGIFSTRKDLRGREGELQYGGEILQGFDTGISVGGEHSQIYFDHLPRPLRSICFRMGGSEFEWSAESMGYSFVDETASGGAAYPLEPIVSQTIYTKHNLAHQAGVMFACAMKQLALFQESSDQEAFQLNLEDVSILRFNYIFFPAEWVVAIFLTNGTAVCPETTPSPEHRVRPGDARRAQGSGESRVRIEAVY